MALKEVYSTLEASLLLGMAVKNLLQRAIREGWQSRRRIGRGGGKEWLVSSMPEETRVAIRTAEEKQALAACPASAPLPALSSAVTTAIMDDRRRYKALARADLVRQYLAWQRKYLSLIHI